MSKLFILAFVLGCSIGCCFANCSVYAAGRKIFKTYDDLKSGSEAKTACEEKGGMLAMPKDKEQCTFLHALDDGEMWIGGTKNDSENWMWVDGTKMPLTTGDGGVWYQHTGGDGPSGNGNCLQIGYEGAVWDDDGCSASNKYACEFEFGEWHYVGDRLVKKDWRKLNYDGAKEACIGDGGFLITDDTPKIHQWLKQEGPLNYWIGASDMEEEGVWKWHEGSSVSSETHWSGDGPDDKWGGENCAVINGSGKWDDEFCGLKNHFACEKRDICPTEKKSKRKVKYHWKH